MAKIRVYRGEADGRDFPRVCVRCGADAEADSTQKFAWMPGWVHVLILVGLLPWLIVCLVTRRTMRVTLPVCYRHRNHWLHRKLYIWLGLLWWVGVGVATALLARDLPQDVVSGLFAFLVFGGLVWLFAGLIYVNGAVKAVDLTDRWIELSGVDKGFAAEWKASEPPPEPRRRRRPARVEVDDDGE